MVPSASTICPFRRSAPAAPDSWVGPNRTPERILTLTVADAVARWLTAGLIGADGSVATGEAEAANRAKGPNMVGVITRSAAYG